MLTRLTMALLLVMAPEADSVTSTGERRGAQPAPISRSTPATTELLYSTGLVSSPLLEMGAWLNGDGSKVAFFVAASPATNERASTLVVKDTKTDAQVWRKALFSQEESRELSAHTLERLVRARLIEAGAQLPGKTWSPMEWEELSEPDFLSDACFLSQSPPQRTATLAGLEVTYREPLLRIDQGGNRLVEVQRPSWRIFNKNCQRFNSSWLRSLALDNSRKVLLIGLGHCGVDACPEPAEAFHAVLLPGRGERLQPGALHATRNGLVRVGFESEESPSRSLYAQGLPAVSADGALVLVGWVEEDGARRDPNLQLEARRVDGNERTWAATLLRAGEFSSSKGFAEKREELNRHIATRVEEVQAELVRGDWKTLKALNPTPVVGAKCVAPPRQVVSIPGFSIRLERGLLSVRGRKSSTVTRTRLAPAFSEEKASCAGESNMFLETTYVDLERKVLLLRLGYCESPECPVPATRFHAVRFP